MGVLKLGKNGAGSDVEVSTEESISMDGDVVPARRSSYLILSLAVALSSRSKFAAPASDIDGRSKCVKSVLVNMARSSSRVISSALNCSWSYEGLTVLRLLRNSEKFGPARPRYPDIADDCETTKSNFTQLGRKFFFCATVLGAQA
jgi:hypothetical protein